MEKIKFSYPYNSEVLRLASLVISLSFLCFFFFLETSYAEEETFDSSNVKIETAPLEENSEQINESEAAIIKDDTVVEKEVITQENISEEKLNEEKQTVSLEKETEAALIEEKNINEMQPTPESLTILQEKETAGIPIFFYIIILVSLILALSGIWLSFYLYKWRKKVLETAEGNNQVIVPEELWASRDRIYKDFSDLNKRIYYLAEQYEDLSSTFLKLNTALDNRDTEIKKLKKGYDQEIYKKFLRRFINTHQAVKDYHENLQSNTEIEQIYLLLTDALEECEVETFSPIINSSYKDEEGVDDNPKKETTKNKDDIGKISKVNEDGYRIKTPEGYEYVLKAKVTVFVKEEKEEE